MCIRASSQLWHHHTVKILPDSCRWMYYLHWHFAQLKYTRKIYMVSNVNGLTIILYVCNSVFINTNKYTCQCESFGSPGWPVRISILENLENLEFCHFHFQAWKLPGICSKSGKNRQFYLKTWTKLEICKF